MENAQLGEKRCGSFSLCALLETWAPLVRALVARRRAAHLSLETLAFLLHSQEKERRAPVCVCVWGTLSSHRSASQEKASASSRAARALRSAARSHAAAEPKHAHSRLLSRSLSLSLSRSVCGVRPRGARRAAE